MRKRGTYYWKQFYSYIFILMIPVCLAVIFYFYAYHVIKGQTDVSNQSFLQNIRKTCDRELQYSRNHMMLLFSNNRIGEINSENDWLRKRRDWNIASLRGDVYELCAAANRAGNFCSDIFVYFKEQNVMVSSRGTMDLNLYIQQYCTEDTDRAKALREYLFAENPKRMVSVQTKWSSDFPSLLLLQTSGKKGKTSPIIMGIWLDVEALEEQITSGAWNESLEWAVVDADDQVILCSGNLGGLDLCYENLTEGISRKLKWNRTNYLLSAVESRTYELKYVILMPETLITGVTDKIRNFFLLANVLCMLALIPLLRYLMRLNYNPLQRLVKLFSLSEENSKGGTAEENRRENEYRYLEEKVRSLFEERSRFRQEMDYMDQVVKEYHLTNLMKNSPEMLEDSPELKNIRKLFQDRFCMVLLLQMEKCSGEDERNVIQTNNLRRFIVRNVFEEGIGECYSYRTVSLGDTVAMVIRLDGPQSAESGFQDTIEQYQQFIKEHFHFGVRAAAGGVHKGSDGIHLSYEEACRASDFLKWEDVDYIGYRDIGGQEVSRYDYPLETEEHIIAALVSQNPTAAVSMIEKVLDANALLNRDAPELNLCLFYHMCGTLRRAAERMGKSGSQLSPLNQISGKNPPGTNREFLRQAAQGLAAEPEKAEEADQNQELCQKVLSYVQTHYNDPDLNVAQTGIHFHMTSAYLSAMLKKQTGKSLLKIINETRIEEAKKLLAQGISVSETGIRTSFRDSSSFIRLFRQMVGVTPGGFREISKNKDS